MENIAASLNEKLASEPLSDNALFGITGLVIGAAATMLSPTASTASCVVTAAITAVEINAVVKKSNIEKDEGKSDLLALSGGVVTGAVTGALANWLFGN